VDDDTVTHLDVGDASADGVDDAGGVAAADVEAGSVALLFAGLDDVDGDAEGGPDVVVVDPAAITSRGPRAVSGRRRLDLLDLECLNRSRRSGRMSPYMYLGTSPMGGI
jgi:hypothetical protein